MGTTEPQLAHGGVMVLATLAVGLVAGGGAVVFRGLIGVFHNLFFFGRFSYVYDTKLHTDVSPWGDWVVVVPVLGAVGVAYLVKTFAPEAKGHGVPEVMDAIYYHEGRIRPVVALIKSVASSLSIGTGGSVGREGPIVQIGSAFGSIVGQIIAMPARQRAILIAGGAGGGIAATFDTPIGGIMFAVELMLPCVTPMSLWCVALASVTATGIGRFFFGIHPAFDVPALASVAETATPFAELPWFVVLGVLMGLVAWLTTRGIYWFEDLFDRVPGNYYTRHMLGMLLVGLIMVGFMTFSSPWSGHPNHYYIQGVGYATIMDILFGNLMAVRFLFVLGIAKLLATCLTLGSGASGGVFSPCMFIGASLGAACGGTLNALFPVLALNPVHFALAGMAAMVGGTTGAAVTATVMVFEMTRDYSVILPVILTVTLASAVCQWLMPATIYTLKLLRRGHLVPQGLQAWMGGLRSRDVMTTDYRVVSGTRAPDTAVMHQAWLEEKVVLLMDEQDPVPRVLLAPGLPDMPDRAVTVPITVGPGDFLSDVLRAMTAGGTRIAVVVQPATTPAGQEILGVITDRQVAAVARNQAKLSG
jgi:chloride channel protein, CIC family